MLYLTASVFYFSFVGKCQNPIPMNAMASVAVGRKLPSSIIYVSYNLVSD